MTPEPYVITNSQARTEDAEARKGCVEPLSAFPTIVGQVFGNPTVPTTTGVYYALHPVDVSGAEAESAAGTLTVDSSRTFYADVIGAGPAMAGDFLICRFVGNRWVAERMGHSQPTEVTVAGCPCVLSPSILYMTSSKPTSNNGIFQSAVLQYGVTPADLLPVVHTASSYLSTESLTDPSLGLQFRYLLSCSVGSYLLTRVYVYTPFGSPFRDITRYSWTVGFPGNTCTPFLLSQGQIFSGGDASCVVTITE